MRKRNSSTTNNIFPSAAPVDQVPIQEEIYRSLAPTCFDLDLSASSSSEDEETEKFVKEDKPTGMDQPKDETVPGAITRFSDQKSALHSADDTIAAESSSAQAEPQPLVPSFAPTYSSDLNLSESSSSSDDDETKIIEAMQELDMILKQNDPEISIEMQPVNRVAAVSIPVTKPKRISRYKPAPVTVSKLPTTPPPAPYLPFSRQAPRTSLICADLTRHFSSPPKNTKNEQAKALPNVVKVKKPRGLPKQKGPAIPVTKQTAAAAAGSISQTNRKLKRNSTKSIAALTAPVLTPPARRPAPPVPVVASRSLQSDLGLVLSSDEEAEALMKIEKISAMEEFVNEEIPAIVKQAETKRQPSRQIRKRRQNSSPMSRSSSLGSPERIPDYQPGSMKLRLRRIWRGRHSHWIIVTGEEIKAEEEASSRK